VLEIVKEGDPKGNGMRCVVVERPEVFVLSRAGEGI
jgi:hypothetical protein